MHDSSRRDFVKSIGMAAVLTAIGPAGAVATIERLVTGSEPAPAPQAAPCSAVPERVLQMFREWRPSFLAAGEESRVYVSSPSRFTPDRPSYMISCYVPEFYEDFDMGQLWEPSKFPGFSDFQVAKIHLNLLESAIDWGIRERRENPRLRDIERGLIQRGRIDSTEIENCVTACRGWSEGLVKI